jgi:hypothetical protein
VVYFSKVELELELAKQRSSRILALPNVWTRVPAIEIIWNRQREVLRSNHSTNGMCQNVRKRF